MNKAMMLTNLNVSTRVVFWCTFKILHNRPKLNKIKKRHVFIKIYYNTVWWNCYLISRQMLLLITASMSKSQVPHNFCKQQSVVNVVFAPCRFCLVLELWPLCLCPASYSFLGDLSFFAFIMKPTHCLNAFKSSHLLL